MAVWLVSTHSRLKAAGAGERAEEQEEIVSTHSRLKAAGLGQIPNQTSDDCFNTQPPEGGWRKPFANLRAKQSVSTHSRLKAAGVSITRDFFGIRVSTHSRLKAAGR